MNLCRIIIYIKISKESDKYFLKYKVKTTFFKLDHCVFCLQKRADFLAHAPKKVNIETYLLEALLSVS